MILRKNSLKYKMLKVLAYLGDAGVEFLVNVYGKGGKVYLHRRYYNSTYYERVFEAFTTTGFIERVRKDGVEHLRLTPKAKTSLRNDIPLPNLQKERWDGYFRGLSYDFPEKLRYKRDVLREQIRDWGMEKFHYSLWITPHPLEDVINDFIKVQRLEKYAYLFMSQKLSVVEGKEIAEQVWRLAELEEKYLKFIDKWDDRIEKKSLKTSDIEQIRFEYFSILDKDSYLPLDLLLEEWPAEQAKDVFFEVEGRVRKIGESNRRDKLRKLA